MVIIIDEQVTHTGIESSNVKVAYITDWQKVKNTRR